MGNVIKSGENSVSPNQIIPGPVNEIILPAAGSTLIVPSNPARHNVILANAGNKDVWLAIDTTATISSGFVLAVGSEPIKLLASEFGTGEINGRKTAGGSATISYQEFTT